MVAIDITSDSLSHYLNQIGQFDVLTREEERKLFQRMEQGDESARERLIACNLRFVVKVAAQFRGRGMPLSDLIQEGNVGLLEVLDKFDWRKGFRFSTYAAFWIRQAIQRSMQRTGSTVRLPSRKARILGRLNRVVETFRAQEHREPTLEEMAAELEMEPDTLAEVIRWRDGVLSLDTPFDDEGGQLMEMIADDNQTNPRAHAVVNERTRRLEEVLERLPAKECMVMRLRHGFETGTSLSLRKASNVMGLSQEGVRRLERIAMAKLRRRSESLELAQLA